MSQLVGRGSTFFDIGAQAGFHTLLASELVGPGGHVYAFEPLPRNLIYLNKHIALNHLSNVSVIAAAVADRSGTAGFDASPGYLTARLSTKGPLQVSTVCLDDLVSRQEVPVPYLMKIDTEGAELRVLNGARKLLSQRRPMIFLDTHSYIGPEFKHIHRECFDFLKAMGYDVIGTGDPLADAHELIAVSPDARVNGQLSD